MFRELRRKDRELTNTEAVKLLENGEYGVLSTVSEDGYAYGVPVNYVYTGQGIYFHCAAEGHKLDNIKKNDKVSFLVVGHTCVLPGKFTSNYESVIVFGRAAEVPEGEKNKILMELINKYSPEYIAKGEAYINNSKEEVKIVKISIEHISGKARR